MVTLFAPVNVPTIIAIVRGLSTRRNDGASVLRGLLRPSPVHLDASLGQCLKLVVKPENRRIVQLMVN